MIGPKTSLPDPAMTIYVFIMLLAPLLYAMEGNIVARWGTFGLDPFRTIVGAGSTAVEIFTEFDRDQSGFLNYTEFARCVRALEAGPDGKSAQRLGRACICWACGHVGLPRNAARCSEVGPLPAGVCGSCGEDGQSNFVQAVSSDGCKLPWIERSEQQVGDGDQTSVPPMSASESDEGGGTEHASAQLAAVNLS